VRENGAAAAVSTEWVPPKKISKSVVEVEQFIV
jgi:hypothetical protein